MSEYGDVVYRLGDGDSWEIYKETVEEWKAEKGFSWSELAFIALDPTTSDQFIAIRNDGTWAGSIDDINEDVLEEFALNFFTKAKKTRNRSRSNHQNGNGTAPPSVLLSSTKPDAATQALYEQWSKDTASRLASALAALGTPTSPPPSSPSGEIPLRPKPRKLQVRSQSSSIPTTTPGPAALLVAFPYLPAAVTVCALPSCELLKAELLSIKACRHDVEMLMRASGLYSYEWLRQERLRWHPDRFGRLCDEAWREDGKKMAEEMFKIIDALMEDLKAAGA
jgi:hypothetical protein